MKRQYLVNKATGQKYRINGYVQASDLSDRWTLVQSFTSAFLCEIGRPPPKVDLRPRMTKVENHSATGSW